MRATATLCARQAGLGRATWRFPLRTPPPGVLKDGSAAAGAPCGQRSLRLHSRSCKHRGCCGKRRACVDAPAHGLRSARARDDVGCSRDARRPRGVPSKRRQPRNGNGDCNARLRRPARRAPARARACALAAHPWQRTARSSRGVACVHPGAGRAHHSRAPRATSLASWDQFDAAFPDTQLKVLFSSAGPTVIKPTPVRCAAERLRWPREVLPRR